MYGLTRPKLTLIPSIIYVKSTLQQKKPLFSNYTNLRRQISRKQKVVTYAVFDRVSLFNSDAFKKKYLALLRRSSSVILCKPDLPYNGAKVTDNFRFVKHNLQFSQPRKCQETPKISQLQNAKDPHSFSEPHQIIRTPFFGK